MSFNPDSSNGMIGIEVAVGAPLAGFAIGSYFLYPALKHVKETQPPDVLLRISAPIFFMMSVCVLCGFILAAILNYQLRRSPDFVPNNAGMSAGCITGLTCCFVAAGVGIFGAAAAKACCQQPRLWVGMILILIFIEAIASYSLIIGLEFIAQAQKELIDIQALHVMPVTSVSILAFLGSVSSSVASGVAIMQVGIMRPDLVMRLTIAVVMSGVIAIYGLIEASVEVGNKGLWPPTGADSNAGILYLVSGLSLAYAGYHGIIKVASDPRRNFINMLMQLIGCESIALLGLCYGLVTLTHERAHGQVDVQIGQSYNAMLVASVGGSFAQHKLELIFAVLVFVGVPLLSALFLGARHRATIDSPFLLG